ncbi:AraC family transcriptional regulator [Sphingomonas sp. QA11]|uniref:helix-turn-helix transcriptional regulator n=1 Tax=Sphingomonas sp. QA11 TaxID=2950605 RepID=UPI00234B185F|nr:AraC family transcriptional regulator [Sphingomonas sp. QA11]WCM29643.1 AraC family transcriptional regulator [Sphingomonas sp. QA11]
MYIDDRPAGLEPQHRGFVRLLDMRSEPWARIDDNADFIRFQLSQRTLDDLAYERGERPLSLLRPRLNIQDAVLHNLCAALLARFDTYGASDSLFIDHVGLAFHAHVVGTYAGRGQALRQRGGLAPWQLRRARDLMMADWGRRLTIRDLAEACGLSVSYFARAFRETTGMPPHQWLMDERLKHATRLLLNTDLSLTEIALSCGFSDQSHMTRVFRQKEQHTPAEWRRSNAR